MEARHSVGSMEAKGSAHGGRSMSFYRGMTCENVTINGDKGTPIKWRITVISRSHFAPPYPARTTIGCASLPLGARIEVGLTAKDRS
jgi:hypothetical protein